MTDSVKSRRRAAGTWKGAAIGSGTEARAADGAFPTVGLAADRVADAARRTAGARERRDADGREAFFFGLRAGMGISSRRKGKNRRKAESP
jgi:hypothetical protein